MLVALVGSQGTGKTTVFNKIKEIHPEYQFFTEGVRHQMPAFGYKDPYEIVDELGIGAFELMNINSWSVIDPKLNTALNLEKNIITDRSAADNYAYYLCLRQTPADFASERLLKSMAKYYASLVDVFVYFPLSTIPLVGDDMRKDSKDHQKNVDLAILDSFDALKVPKTKIYTLKAVGLEDRVKEVLTLF